VVVPPDAAQRLSDQAQSHDAQSRADRDADTPYWERRQAEEKMRAHPSVTWEP